MAATPLTRPDSPLEVALSTLQRTRGLCVFDLDSTLLDNRPRQALILREFGESVGEAALAKVGPEHFAGWDLGVAMRNAGLSPERSAELRDRARGFWKERFFTSEYCRHDVPVRGAVNFALAVVATGAQIVYLTGRHAGMEEGTLTSFRTAGFPIPDGKSVQLILKPTLEMHDDLWKDQACERVLAIGQVAAAFDNEPTHINRYHELFRGALCVHLATDHSGRPIPLAPGIPSIPNFLR